MRPILTLFLLLAPALLAAKPPPPPPHGPFLSPMGEPFRSHRASADNVGAWFAAADRDRDGALTEAELRGDSERFFALLDSDRDGELEPVEIVRYENEVAPEVQVGLQMRSSGVGEWGGNRKRKVVVYGRGVDGGARYSFLKIPHPVMAADSDMNRGVSKDEFARAAEERFGLLDRDRDGRLMPADLPPLPQPRVRRIRGESENPLGRRRD